jgi:hypothetical protein
METCEEGDGVEYNTWSNSASISADGSLEAIFASTTVTSITYFLTYNDAPQKDREMLTT